MKRRIVSVLTALAVMLSLCPTWALAAEEDPSLCRHHRSHTAECGCEAPTEGQPCGHEHTDKCYTEETLCVHLHDETCYSDGLLPTGDEDKEADACAHVCTVESGCVTRTLDCHHSHDGECGYVPADPGTPCGYVCRLCPIEDRIAALPEEAAADNRDKVEAQLREILALYGDLSEEEQGQVSISRCLALRDQLDALDGQPGEQEPALAAETTGVKYLNESGAEETCPSATVVESSTTVWRNGWYVVNGDVTLSGRADIYGDVHLILADGCHLDAGNGGIEVSSGKSLTIYAQSMGNDMGALTATATGSGHAGIGSDSGSCGTITVNGGRITATGGGGSNTAAGSGIGCNYSGTAADITINGGEVTATGGSSPLRGGAGIGATHPDASGVVITINGGTVNATGGNSTNNCAGGSGIGIGADSYYGGTVTINGGTITAVGGNGSPAGGTLCAGTSQVEYWGGTVNGTEYHSYYVIFNPSDVPAGVTFAPPQQRVRSDELVTRPPEVDGWTVTWHEGSAGGTVFDFTQPVSQDTTLYAVWEKNTDYVAEVAIGGSTASYTTLNAAWASLKGQTGTITLLRDVDTNGTTLVVESGMDVTVEMSAGMALTNSTADCFQVKGGTLTLASGRVIENQSDCSVVYAASGILRMTGAVCQSTGNGLWVDSGVTVRLSSGAINVPSGKTALRYESKAVRDMLAAGCALKVNGGDRIALTELDQETLSGGNYIVEACDSTGTVSHSNGDGTHTLGGCPYCGAGAVVGPHTFDEGSRTCTGCGAAMVVKVEADGAACYYEDINAAWDHLPDGKSSVTVLADTSHEKRLEVGSGKDVTVNMPDGVTLTHNAKNYYTSNNSCFYVKGGTLTLESGTVVDTGTGTASHYAMYIEKGQLYVKGGTYTSGGNSYGSCVHAPYPSNKPVIRLTGGTLSGTDGSHVLYWNNTQGMVKAMLAEGYALKSGETFITLDTLNTYQFNYGSPCAVVECPHGDSVCQSNLDGTHTKGACTYCGFSGNKAEPHTLKEGSNVCADCGTAMVAEVAANGATTYYEDVNTAWASLKGKTGTITLLQNADLGKALEVIPGMNVTVKMNDGVILTSGNTNARCFWVTGGTLTLESGKVNCTDKDVNAYIVYVSGGAVYVKGGTYQSSGSGLRVASGATIQLSSGTTIEAEEAVLFNNGGPVRNMLENTGLVLLNNKTNKRVTCKTTGEITLSAGSYTVIECNHDSMTDEDYSYTTNKDGTHTGTCVYCGGGKTQKKCRYGTGTNGTAGCQDCHSALSVTVNDEGVVYDGTEKNPGVTVKADGSTLPENAYSLEYSGNIKAGTGTASVTVTGAAFDGTCTQTFSIGKGTPAVTVSAPAETVYDSFGLDEIALRLGAGGTPGTVELDAGQELTAGTKNYNWTFTPEDTANYNPAAGTVSLAVVKDTLQSIAITRAPAKTTYTYGETFDPAGMEVTAAYASGKTRVVTDEVTVSPATLTAATTALTIACQGQTAAQAITVHPKEVTNPTIELSPGTFVYDGTGKEPAVTVKDGGTVIPAGEYTVAYSGNINVGTAAVTITGRNGGNYTVSGAAAFTITKANQAALTITGAPGSVTYGDTFQLGFRGGSGTGAVSWAASGAAVDNAGNVTITRAGPVTITAMKDGDGNYFGTEAQIVLNVSKKTLTVTGAAAQDRQYNGTGAVTITGVALGGIVGSDAVSVDVAGLTGTLNGSNVGSYTAVTLPALTLTGGKADNYTLTRPAGAVSTSVTISKADALTPKTGDLAVINNQAHTYTYGVGALRPDPPAGMSLGSTAVTYTLGAVSLGGYYGGSGAKLEGQTLTLPVEAVKSSAAGGIGTVQVIIHTGNFQDMTATINVRSVNKKLPAGEPVLSAAALTYGQAIGEIKLSGGMRYGGAEVPGTFSWNSPGSRPAAQDSYRAAWTFTPDNSEEYAAVTGTSAIRVNPASIRNAVVTLSEKSFPYDGQLHSPGITGVSLNGTALREGTDYTASIPQGREAGTYTVTLTGTGNYTGTASAVFRITAGGGPAASIKEMKKTGSRLEATLEGELASGDRLAVAFYNGDGRLLGVRIQDAAVRVSVRLAAGASSARAMLLDSGWCPLCPERTLAL